MRRFVLLCACWGLLCGLYAQYHGWTNYTWGPDAKGVMFSGNYAWVATSGGLVRIDRSSLELTHFNHANSGLPGNGIGGIAIDGAGNLWLRYMNSLVKYDGSSWQTFASPFWGFTCMDIAPDGTIWLGTGSGGLIRFDGAVFTQYTNFSNHAYPEASNVSVDGHGRVWFSTNYFYIDENNFGELLLPGALMYYDGAAFTVFSPAFSPVTVRGISEIAFDAANRLWVGTAGGGIWYHDGSYWTNFNTDNSGMASDYISHLAFDIQGRLWASHLQGLDCFDGISWHAFTPANSSIPSNHFYNLAADPAGPVWVGFLEGLLRIGDQGMQLLQLSNSGLSSSRVTNQVQAADGTMWFATGHGLDFFDGENWGHFDLSAGAEYLMDLEFDFQGRLWIASQYHGLFCFDGSQFINYNVSNSALPSNGIGDIEIDPQGRVWLGLPYNGVVCFDGVAWTLYNTDNSPLPTNQVTALTVDTEGRAWIGCFYQPNQLGGLAVLDGDGWSFYDTSNSGLPSILVKTIEVRDGVAWIGTNNGLASFDGSSWQVYNTSNSGLPGNEIDSITFDSNGHLLIGTHSAGLVHYAQGVWTVWNSSNSGIASNRCDYLLVAPNDQIWIGAGVSVFEHGASLILDPMAPPPSALLRAWPNPFASQISFDGWPERGETRIGLFNLRGQKIADWNIPAGHELTLDLASRGLDDLPNGVYLWRLDSGRSSVWCRTLKCE
ncbi:MAG: hypothetical protein K0B87_03880 [Candidatus Syntrophosphaera sp.]|nr:hypothetical protein [Candidatus Syntrophosphaera sp.]